MENYRIKPSPETNAGSIVIVRSILRRTLNPGGNSSDFRRRIIIRQEGRIRLWRLGRAIRDDGQPSRRRGKLYSE